MRIFARDLFYLVLLNSCISKYLAFELAPRVPPSERVIGGTWHNIRSWGAVNLFPEKQAENTKALHVIGGHNYKQHRVTQPESLAASTLLPTKAKPTTPPKSLSSAMAMTMDSEYSVLCGGYSKYDPDKQKYHLNDQCWIHHNEVWQPLTPMKSPAAGSASVVISKNQFVLIGGYNHHGFAHDAQEGFINPEKSSIRWKHLSRLPMQVSGACAVYDSKKENLYLIGGHDSAQIYDSILVAPLQKILNGDNAWTEASSHLLEARTNHGCSLIPGHGIAVAGGRAIGVQVKNIFKYSALPALAAAVVVRLRATRWQVYSKKESALVLTSLELISLHDQTVKSLPKMTFNRYGLCLYSMGNRLLALGGIGTESAQKTIEEYNFSTHKWKTSPQRLFHERGFFALFYKGQKTVKRAKRQSNPDDEAQKMAKANQSEEVGYEDFELSGQETPLTSKNSSGFNDILVAGYHGSEANTKPRLVALNNSIVKIKENTPLSGMLVIGGVLDDTVVVCGGSAQKFKKNFKLKEYHGRRKCYGRSKGSKSWLKLGQLPRPVLAPGSVVVSHKTAPGNHTDRLFTIGGFESLKSNGTRRLQFYNDTIYMTLEQGRAVFTEPFPFLKEARAGMEVVYIQNKYLITIGGHNATHSLQSVEVYNFEESLRHHTYVPALHVPRAYFGCSYFKDQKFESIICAGGININSKEVLATIEIWQFDNFEKALTGSDPWKMHDLKLIKPSMAIVILNRGLNNSLIYGGSSKTDKSFLKFDSTTSKGSVEDLTEKNKDFILTWPAKLSHVPIDFFSHFQIVHNRVRSGQSNMREFIVDNPPPSPAKYGTSTTASKKKTTSTTRTTTTGTTATTTQRSSSTLEASSSEAVFHLPTIPHSAVDSDNEQIFYMPTTTTMKEQTTQTSTLSRKATTTSTKVTARATASQSPKSTVSVSKKTTTDAIIFQLPRTTSKVTTSLATRSSITTSATSTRTTSSTTTSTAAHKTSPSLSTAVKAAVKIVTPPSTVSSRGSSSMTASTAKTNAFRSSVMGRTKLGILQLGGLSSTLKATSTASLSQYEGVTLRLPPAPSATSFSSGMVLSNQEAVLFCGGYKTLSLPRLTASMQHIKHLSNECFYLDLNELAENRRWQRIPSLPMALAESASATFHKGDQSTTMIMFGGVVATETPEKGHCPGPPKGQEFPYSSQILLLELDNANKRTNFRCLSNLKVMHPVAGACSAVDQEKNLVYLLGGRNKTRYHKSVLQYTMSTEVENPVQLPDLLTGRSSLACHVVTLSQSHRALIVAGGIQLSLEETSALKEVEMLNLSISPGAMTWQKMSSLQQPSFGMTILSMAHNRLFIMGGITTQRRIAPVETTLTKEPFHWSNLKVDECLCTSGDQAAFGLIFALNSSGAVQQDATEDGGTCTARKCHFSY